MNTDMDDGLYKLVSWMSPAYPVGAYTYSHGLEHAVSEGHVRDAATATRWISDCVEHGAGRTDAILLAHTYRAAREGDGITLCELSELAFALAPSSERLLETEAMGGAFAKATEAAWSYDGCEHPPYVIAIGGAAARHGIELSPTLEIFLHAYASNLISACIRLVPLGQTEGQKILSALMPVVQRVAHDAIRSDIGDVGGCALGSDIASIKHETQNVRLFRS